MYQDDFDKTIANILAYTAVEEKEIRASIEKLAEKFCEDPLLTATIILSFSESVFNIKHFAAGPRSFYTVWMKIYESLRVSYVDQGTLISFANHVLEYSHQEVYDSLSFVNTAVMNLLLSFVCYECQIRYPLGLDISIDLMRPLDACCLCVYCHNKKIRPGKIDVTPFILNAQSLQSNSEYVSLILTCIPSFLYKQIFLESHQLTIRFLKTVHDEPLEEEVKNCFYLLQQNGFICSLEHDHEIVVSV